MTRRPFAETLASRLLARDGMAAIWSLHVAAAAEHRNGRLETAAALVALADAVEHKWLSDGGDA